MKTFLVLNDSSGEKQEMSMEKLFEFFEGLDMPEFDEEVLIHWAKVAESGESTKTGIWGPYFIMCL